LWVVSNGIIIVQQAKRPEDEGMRRAQQIGKFLEIKIHNKKRFLYFL
jgi:hypothetical protein